MTVQLHTGYRGFSLLEVLVAFSIFSVAIAIIYQIYAKGSTAAILAGEYATAVAIAESRLADASIVDELENDDNHGVAQDRYHWRIETEPWANTTDFAPADATYQLKKVSVLVRWQSRGHSREVILDTLKPFVAR